jgi:hypothetical protein
LVRQSGFQTPIVWGGHDAIRDLPTRIKLHVVFEGAKNTDIRLSALYLRP